MASASAASTSAPVRRRRVAIFGTHPQQFNGYSKVLYELLKAVVASDRRDDFDLHHFGFQKFHSHPAHRMDVPPEITVHDAFANEEPRAAGFGVKQARAYVERIRPDVVIVFNDLMVLTSVVNELKDASNRGEFKLLAYIDQVYLSQRRAFIDHVNAHCDAAIAFTPQWRDCIQWQGLKLKTYVLDHGINPATYFPVPKRLARRFYGIPDSDFLVLNLNRNQPRKRWDTCMQAFAEVVARRPEAPIKLVIATQLTGAWDLLELLRRELRKRNVENADEVAVKRVVVPGHPQQLTDEETNALLNVADIGINTCDGEGFGLCNFEQAAIGIPQIVPRLGGFLHIFEKDETALMIDPVTSIYIDASRDGVGGEALLSRSADYADAILRLYDDAQLRERIGASGRKRILEKFPWTRVARDFCAILDDVLPPAPAPAPTIAPGQRPAEGEDASSDMLDPATFEKVIREEESNSDAGAVATAREDEIMRLRAQISSLTAAVERLSSGSGSAS